MATVDAWDDDDEWAAGVAEIAEKLRISEANDQVQAAQAVKSQNVATPRSTADVQAPSPSKVPNVKIIEKPKLPPAAPAAPPRILASAPEDGGSMAAAHRKRELQIRSREEEIDSAILSCLDTHRNRMQLLEIEEKILRFAQSEENETFFPPVYNSYWRMLHFRIADRFRLAHTLSEETGALIIYKTEDFSLPRTLIVDMDLDALYRHHSREREGESGSGLGGSRNGSGNSIDSLGDEGGEGKGGGAPRNGGNGGGKKVMLIRRSTGKGPGGTGGGRGGSSAYSNPSDRARNGKGGKGSGSKKGGDADSDKERAYAEARARIFAGGGGANGGGGGPPSVFNSGTPPGR